jgi:hypothetical protein
MRSSKPYSKPAIRESMLPSDSHPGPLRPGCAQPLFAIMHRSRAALLSASSTGCAVKQRGRRVVAVADPGSRQSAGVSVSRACDPKSRTRSPPHCATGPAHPSPRPADELAKLPALPGAERANLVPVEQHRKRWTSRSTRQRRRGPALTRPRTARERGDDGRGDDVVDGVRCARGGDRGAQVPQSRSSTDGRRRPHPGMDEALVAVDSRRKR